MSHGKAVWRRLRFFFYKAPAILSTGPLLRLRVNAVSCVVFFLFFCDSAISLPCDIFRDTLSCFVPPGWPFWRDCGFQSFFVLLVHLSDINSCHSKASFASCYLRCHQKIRLYSFSSCSLFERWGQYIDVFLPSLVLIPSRAPQKSRTPKKAYSRHYDVFEAPLASRFTVHNFSLAVLVACRT